MDLGSRRHGSRPIPVRPEQEQAWTVPTRLLHRETGTLVGTDRMFGSSGAQKQLSEDAARGQPLVRLGSARELEAARDARVEAPGGDSLEDLVRFVFASTRWTL
jgi:hypothetical protein